MGKSIIQAWEKRFREEPEHQEFPEMLEERLDKFLKELPEGAKVLDLGCGNGDKSKYIHDKGFRVLGVDSSESAIQYARQNYSEDGLEFRNEDVLNLDIKQDFNGIVSIAFHHCLPKKSRKRVNEKIESLLREGGCFFILDLSSKDKTLKKNNDSGKRSFEKSGMYFHLFTREELIREFDFLDPLILQEHVRDLKEKKNSVFTGIFRK